MFTKTGTKKNNYYNVICQNCGDKGHHIKDCINLVTSLGIILYRFIGPTIQYLAVCRKNTIGFVEFIRGKYAINDTAYIQQLFNVMTEHEITLITDKEFEFLWEFLWMDKQFNKVSSKVKRDYDSEKKQDMRNLVTKDIKIQCSARQLIAKQRLSYMIRREEEFLTIITEINKISKTYLKESRKYQQIENIQNKINRLLNS